MSGLVSTHSRAEAAAVIFVTRGQLTPSFNTQPRGGGCSMLEPHLSISIPFQHTAARRRLQTTPSISRTSQLFQHTATRRWLRLMPWVLSANVMFQHTAAQRRLQAHRTCGRFDCIVSTHSRPKAAATGSAWTRRLSAKFQHTAARRRLPLQNIRIFEIFLVSTHSRAEAAA